MEPQQLWLPFDEECVRRNEMTLFFDVDLLSALDYVFGAENVVVWDETRLEERMEGTVVRVMEDKGFGFIKGDVDKKDYFFHQSDLNGFFEDLVHDLQEGKVIRVTFEATIGQKGPRAAQVTRIDGGV